MRHVAVIVLFVVAALSACDDTSSRGIEVIPGPEMRVQEGKTVVHELLLDGERGATFEIALDELATERFAEAAAVTENGVTYLKVKPKCSAIDSGVTNSLLERIEVSAPNATPVIVTVAIEPSENNECEVRVAGWAGACANPPAMIDPDAPIQLDPTIGTDQPICVEVTVPDSFTSIDVTFPFWGALEPLTISGDDLLGIGPGTSHRELVATGVLGKFRGRRDIDVQWTDGGAARLVVTAGDPGDGVLRIRSTAANVSEYQPAIVRFASSYYEKEGTVACVRATPHAPTTMTLVIRSDLDEIIPQGALACGVTINAIELVTAMDSAAAESIDVTLERCTPSPGCTLTDSACCARSDALVELIDTGALDVPSRSVAEAIEVGRHGERVCIDLEGDNIPEVIVRDAAGPRISVATGTPHDIRFAPGTSFPMAQSMLALSWFNGEKVFPILVGEFNTAPFLRRANKAGWDVNQWAPLPASITAARDWVPVAPQRGAGASYLAVRQTNSRIAFACVSPVCRGIDAAMIDVAQIDTGPAQFPMQLSGYTVADFDGDLDLDLVVAVDGIIPIGSTRPITMYAYDLVWNGHEIVDHGPAIAFTAASTGVSWSGLSFVSLPAGSDGDLIYAFASGSTTQQAIVEISTCGSGCRTSRIVQPIGRPYKIAGVGTALFAATDLGIWELANQTWVQRDPERVRTQQTTIPVPDPTSTYGEQLESCLLADPALPPSILFDVEAGARWSFANVEVDTLPGP